MFVDSSPAPSPSPYNKGVAMHPSISLSQAWASN